MAKQTITFKIEVEHPAPLKPEGEWRAPKSGERFVGPGSAVERMVGDSRWEHLVVFLQPTPAEELAEYVLMRDYVSHFEMTHAHALAHRVKAVKP